MSLKHSASIDVGYPITGVRFLNNRTVLVAGGGGEGNNGIANKITAVKCSLAADPARRLQRFREITLPANEDSPQCLDTARTTDDDSKFSLLVGCNQSSQLIKTMSINNNLRKYVLTKDEHMRFVDAVQFEDPEGNSSEDYPKIVKLSPHSSVGCFMTSAYPLNIYIFDPESLSLKHKFAPEKPTEIKDFVLCPDTDGATLCFVTADSIEAVLTNSGDLTLTTAGNKSVEKALSKYILYRVTYIDASTVLVAACLRKGKGAALIKYSLSQQKILKVSHISKTYKIVVAMDYSKAQNLVAVVGNDLSVDLVNASSFKVIKTFRKLHEFAITSASFSPNGRCLATASAAKTLHVLDIPPKFARGKLIFMSLFQSILTILFMAAIAIGIQRAHDNGELYRYQDMALIYLAKLQELWIEHGKPQVEKSAQLSKVYGKVGMNWALEQGLVGYDIVRSKIKDFNAEHVALTDALEFVPSISGTTTQSTVPRSIVSLTESADQIIMSDTLIASDFDSRAYSRSMASKSTETSSAPALTSDHLSAEENGASIVSSFVEPMASNTSKAVESESSVEPVIPIASTEAQIVAEPTASIAHTPTVSLSSASVASSSSNEKANDVESEDVVGSVSAQSITEEVSEEAPEQVSSAVLTMVTPVPPAANVDSKDAASSMASSVQATRSLPPSTEITNTVVSQSDEDKRIGSDAGENSQPEAEKQEQEKRVKEEQEKRAKEEQEKRAKEEQEKRAKEEQEKRVKEEQEKRAKEEQEKRAKEEQEKRAKEEQEKRAKEEQEKRAKEEQEKRAKEEQEKRAKEEQEKRAKEEQEKSAKKEQEKRAKEEQDQREKQAEEQLKMEKLENEKREQLERENDERARIEQERIVEQEQQRHAEEEERKRARAEQEKRAAQEQEQRAREQLKKEQLENEKREQLAREQAELARIEQERLVKQEQEERAKLEQEKQAREEQALRAAQEQQQRDEEAQEKREQAAREELEQEKLATERRQQLEREMHVQNMLADARQDRKQREQEELDQERRDQELQEHFQRAQEQHAQHDEL